MKTKTILHPEAVRDKQSGIPYLYPKRGGRIAWPYIVVNWYSTHGTWPMLDILSTEDAAKLQRLRNMLEKR